jgi:hypothetical protein
MTSKSGGILSALRGAALFAVVAGAGASLAFMLRAGHRQNSRILLLLFGIWVLFSRQPSGHKHDLGDLRRRKHCPPIVDYNRTSREFGLPLAMFVNGKYFRTTEALAFRQGDVRAGSDRRHFNDRVQ